MNLTKSKVAIVSDLHLGVHSNSTYWHNVAIDWAKWLKSELNKQNIVDIVFCGDWHHNRSEISVNTLQVSADILEILSEFNILAITGNHDIYFKHRTDVNSLSIFKGRRNITIIENAHTIKAFNKTITFCPWNTSLEDIPNSDILFGHLEVETFKMNSFKMCEEGFKVKDLLNKAKLVISGHFHYRHEKRFEIGSILYVGNPFQMDFGDSGNEKGYYILDIDKLKYQFIENKISPQYKKISLSELVVEGSLNDRVRQLFYKNLVKLKIDKNISQEDLDFLLKKLNTLQPESIVVDYDINFNKIISNNTLKEDFSGIDVSAAIVEFINLLDIEDKKSVIDYTINLYNKCNK